MKKAYCPTKEGGSFKPLINAEAQRSRRNPRHIMAFLILSYSAIPASQVSIANGCESDLAFA